MQKGDQLPTYVALDTETTGLDPEQDAIIEIGAVKFRGQECLDTFQTLVNPYRELPHFIQRLTGITQRNVDTAPPFAAVAGELLDFIGQHPLVGHNINFDLKFLSRQGLQTSNDAYDTWDLASILLPYCANYSLSSLARELGPEHDRPHRALPDAQATQKVFAALLDRANRLDPAIGMEIRHLASRARWSTGRLFGARPSLNKAQVSKVGLTGLDMESLGKRLKGSRRSVKPRSDMRPVNEDELATYLAPGGAVSRTFPGFEHREQQVEMMRSVAAAMNGGEHLIVEGGTGVGKSLAYLLPAILYSVTNGTRVVVSTNTINLQEQLLQKDIPALVRVLEGEGIIPQGAFKVVSLKGRDNYLCLRRWNRLASGESLSGDEVRLLGKTLIWLQDTSSGDKGEINLSGKDALSWSSISAGQKGECPGVRGEGICFLRAARDRAEGAHMVIVNHALLLSDLALGGGLLPEFQHLVIDEAHHLEEGATHQLGFQVSQDRLEDELDSLGRLLGEVRVLFRRPSSSGIQMQRGEGLLTELDSRWPKRMQDDWGRLWNMAEKFLNHHHQDVVEQSQLRITSSSRAQPGWSDVELAWENVDLSLGDGIKQADRLRLFIETLPPGDPVEPDGLALELYTWLEGLEELRQRLKVMLTGPHEEQRIDWINRVDSGRDGSFSRSCLVVHSVPLNVGPELDARLFSRKSSVVLTSATLSTQGNFDYIRERIGLAGSKDLLVGSPFNYSRAAQLLVADDIPLPNGWGYQQAMEKVLVEIGTALEGHTLVLFTSHSALRGVARAVRGPLEAEGIRVFAQGVDGSTNQILQRFAEEPRGLILGTSSFWEGVDLAGGVLRSLVVARLPFHVPTEPVFEARSDQYEDAFHQYALPQAVLRFRQGIGRLIRGSQDKGVIIVLDKRIIARPYGRAFLDSIPPCTVKCVPLTTIPEHAVDWVGNRR